ncbi:unnamed protein product [Cochlearia groenlandica]
MWIKFESMEVFKYTPQNPHFGPLLATSHDSRELYVVGLMLTFTTLLEEVKNLQLDDPISSAQSLNESFTELEKHGFDITQPKLRIVEFLSLREKKVKKMEDLEDVEKVNA